MLRVAAIAGVGLVAAAATGCGGGSAPNVANRSSERIVEQPRTSLTGALLSDADLRGLHGLPSRVSAASVNATASYTNPDPRAPCGTPVRAPDFARGQVISISGPRAVGGEIIIRVGDAAARAYLEALHADLHEGCAPFTSVIPGSSEQRVTLVRAVRLGALATDRVGFVQTIAAEGRQSVGNSIVLRSGGVIVSVLLFTPSPLTDRAIRGLANAAYRRFEHPR